MTKTLAIFAALACLAQAGAARNACEVLTKKDLAAVQGESFKSTKLTQSSDATLVHSQCFYELPTFPKSVSVVIMTPAPGAEPMRSYWKRHFEEARSEEGEEETVRVRGVGDEAVWSGNHLVGSLYILRRNAILRLSVGGPGTKEQKIAKAKRLGLRALARLSG